MRRPRRTRSRPILRFVVAVVGRPRLTLAITLALVAASLALAWGRLSLSTDENKLFSGDVPFFRDYLAFDRNFPEGEATYVLVAGRGTARTSARSRSSGGRPRPTRSRRSSPR